MAGNQTTEQAQREDVLDAAAAPAEAKTAGAPAEAAPTQEAERRGRPDRRASVIDRRLGLDRRRGPGHRRTSDRRSAEEGEMTDEQFAFLMAMDRYKQVNRRPFPTWTEVLDVIHAMGYRRVAEPQDLG